MYLTKYYYETKLPSGEIMLMNFLTGKVFHIQERIRKAIRNWKTTGDLSALDFLIHHRFLFTDEGEEQKLIREKAERYQRELSEKTKLYGLCLTYDCNLRCPYCYENGIGRQGTLMSKEMIDRAMRGIGELNEKLESKSSMLVLFGGEPFMECNRKAVEYFFDAAEKFCIRERENGRKCRIVLFSNGYELGGFLPLLEHYKKDIDSIMLTLNGTKEVHDKVKRPVDAGSSFDRTVNAIEKFLEMGIPVNVRCDVDKSNIRFLAHAADYVMERGWQENPLFRYYISPIKWNENGTCMSEGEILKSFIKLDGIHGGKLSAVFELGALRIVHNMIGMLEGSDESSMAYFYCEAVKKQQYVFGTDGYIYKCLSSIGKPELAFGEYGDGVVMYSDREERWSTRNVLSIPKCRECRFAFVCGGGCALVAEQGGDLYEPKCEDVRAVVDGCLYAADKGRNVVSYGFYYDGNAEND